MADTVNFNNREEFESYMKALEAKYYNSVNLPKSPYSQSVPSFGGRDYEVA